MAITPTIYWAYDSDNTTLTLNNQEISGTHTASGSFAGDVPNPTTWEEYANNITTVNFAGAIAPKYTKFWFFNHHHLTTFNNFSNLDMSNVESTVSLFQNCEALTSLDLSDWDMSNNSSIRSMFDGCTSLTTLTLSNWDTSSVVDMNSAFWGVKKITSLNLSNWDVSRVVDMYGMFKNCTALTSLNLSGWDTTNVTNMGYMFSSCSSLATLNIQNWIFSGATYITSMFETCTALTSINVSSWDTSQLYSTEKLFSGCRSLQTLDLSNWKITGVSEANSMFSGCSSLRTIYASEVWRFDATAARSSGMFYNCSRLVGAISYDANKTDGNYANYTTGYFTYKRGAYAFYRIYNNVLTLVNATTDLMYTSIDTRRAFNIDNLPPWANLNTFTTVNITNAIEFYDASCLFYGASALTTLIGLNNLSFTLSASDSASAKYMFRNCTSLPYSALDNLNMSGVYNVYGMFEGCTGLTNSPKFLNATDIRAMSYCFSGCSNLESLSNMYTNNLNNLGNINQMDFTFNGCSKLVLDNVVLPTGLTYANSCFRNCTALTSYDGLSMSSPRLNGCFYGCSSLTSVTLTATNIIDMTQCFYNCISLTSVDTTAVSTMKELSWCYFNCISLVTAPAIKGHTTSNVTMSYCFCSCTSLTSVPTLSGKLYNMSNCFSQCSSLINPPNFSNVTGTVNMEGCFVACSLMTSMPNLSHLSQLTNLSGCFAFCRSLVTTTTLPSNVDDMSSTFYECTSLITAPAIPTSVTGMQQCFYGCKNLTTAPTIPASVSDVASCFYDCSALSGTITVNSTRLDLYTGFIARAGLTSSQPLKVTGSTSDNNLINLAQTGGDYVYANKNASLNYASPVLSNLTLQYCNQDGTLNANGQYVKVNIHFNYFVAGTPNDISTMFINYLHNLTLKKNGVTNIQVAVKDSNGTSYNMNQITDLTKDYYFVVYNPNRLPIVIELQTSDEFNNSNIVKATLDYNNPVNTTLKYKHGTTLDILRPMTSAKAVTLLDNTFAYNNVEDIIWNEIFRKG